MFYPDIQSGALPISPISGAGRVVNLAGGKTLDGTMRHRRLRVPRATATPHSPTRQFQKGPIQAAVTSVSAMPISAKIYPNSKPEKPSRSCCSQAQRAIGARGNAISAFSKGETPSLCEDIENDYAQAEREPD